MFKMYASNYHSYTHLILALGIVREPTLWVFMISKYPGIHEIGLPNSTLAQVCPFDDYRRDPHGCSNCAHTHKAELDKAGCDLSSFVPTLKNIRGLWACE